MIPDLAEVIRKQNTWVTATQNGAEPAIDFTLATLLGCRAAIQRMQANLVGLEFPVTQLITPCADGLGARLNRIRRTGSVDLPDILALFWDSVGGVGFADLDNYSHVEFWSERDVAGAEETTDAVWIYPCSDEWEESLSGDIEAWRDLDDAERADENGFLIPLAPDHFHKDNISGGGPYGLLACKAFTPPWRWDGWSGYAKPESAVAELDLVSYLRTSLLECAGFPGLFGSPVFEPFRVKILQDVPVF